MFAAQHYRTITDGQLADIELQHRGQSACNCAGDVFFGDETF